MNEEVKTPRGSSPHTPREWNVHGSGHHFFHNWWCRKEKRGFKSEWRDKGDIKPNTVDESCLDPSWDKSNVKQHFLRHKETFEFNWVFGDVQKVWPVLGVWFRDSVSPSFPRLPPCLELHMEVFRGKMMKCQEFSLMYCRKKKEREEEEWGDVSVGKCWSLLNPGDGSLLYN